MHERLFHVESSSTLFVKIGHLKRLRFDDLFRSKSRESWHIAMKLSQGEKAPLFKAQTLSGETSLADVSPPYRHLKFLRFAGCPVCNLEVREYIARYNDLRALGVATMMFFHTPLSELRTHFADSHAPFRIISDPERKIYKLFGVEQRWTGMFSISFMVGMIRGMASGFISKTWGQTGGMTGLPADFIVDCDGIIRLAHYGRNAADSFHVNRVIDAVFALKDQKSKKNLGLVQK